MMPDDLPHELIVRSLFADRTGKIYQKGDRITDAQVIAYALENVGQNVMRVGKLQDKAEAPTANVADGTGAVHV